MTLLHDLNQMILQHRGWAGLVLGVLAFGESLLIVGAFLPATPLLVLAGGLIGSGVLDARGVVAGAMLGAIAGDAVSFRIGQRWGPRILRLQPLQAHEGVVAGIVQKLNRYGVAMIFAGRFFGPFRALVPVLAGLSGMAPHRFYPANIISALAWVIVLVAPGYLVGRHRTALSPHDLLWISLASTLAIIAALGSRQILRPHAQSDSQRPIQ